LYDRENSRKHPSLSTLMTLNDTSRVPFLASSTRNIRFRMSVAIGPCFV
jgi:hypothetical protein